jgi:chaperonin GroES
MNVRPVHDRLVVRRAKAVEKTAGSILVPDTAQRLGCQDPLRKDPAGQEETGKGSLVN